MQTKFYERKISFSSIYLSQIDDLSNCLEKKIWWFSKKVWTGKFVSALAELNFLEADQNSSRISWNSIKAVSHQETLLVWWFITPLVIPYTTGDSSHHWWFITPLVIHYTTGDSLHHWWFTTPLVIHYTTGDSSHHWWFTTPLVIHHTTGDSLHHWWFTTPLVMYSQVETRSTELYDTPSMQLLWERLFIYFMTSACIIKHVVCCVVNLNVLFAS